MSSELKTSHRVCAKCNSDQHLITQKQQFSDSNKWFSLHFCDCIDGFTQTTVNWIDEATYAPLHTTRTHHIIETLREQLEYTERQLKRYKAREAARDALLESGLMPTPAQEHEASTEDAQSVYENFGRDEWPSME